MSDIIITANKSMALIEPSKLKTLMDEFEKAMENLAFGKGPVSAVNAAGDNLCECVMDNKARILAAMELAEAHESFIASGGGMIQKVRLDSAAAAYDAAKGTVG